MLKFSLGFKIYKVSQTLKRIRLKIKELLNLDRNSQAAGRGTLALVGCREDHLNSRRLQGGAPQLCDAVEKSILTLGGCREGYFSSGRL